MQIIADIYERWGAMGCLVTAIATVLIVWALRWALA